jgi:hypothetical protein
MIGIASPNQLLGRSRCYATLDCFEYIEGRGDATATVVSTKGGEGNKDRGVPTDCLEGSITCLFELYHLRMCPPTRDAVLVFGDKTKSGSTMRTGPPDWKGHCHCRPTVLKYSKRGGADVMSGEPDREGSRQRDLARSRQSVGSRQFRDLHQCLYLPSLIQSLREA